MITISLCMVVRNEETILGRLLKTMSSAADQVVIVDTGSTDQTKEITACYMDEVHDPPWADDLATTRNAVYQRAMMDYWVWMDADDVMKSEQAAHLMELKENLDPSVDMVMMKCLTDLDGDGKTSFSYYRECLLRSHRSSQWQGRMHGVVTPIGSILCTDIEIQYRKKAAGDKNRNLRIYETMLNQGEPLEPEHQFYYARELYYHKRYEDTVRAFRVSLQEPKGWVENEIDACLHLALCEEHLGHTEKAMEALLKDFLYDTPCGKTCYKLGRTKMMDERYKEAAYWYTQALSSRSAEQTNTSVRKDCYGFLSTIQLCVCYDRLGDYRRAWRYHLKP